MATEDDRLRKLVEIIGDDFGEIAKHMPGRDRRQCFLRYTKSLDPMVRSGRWSPEEDEALIRAVEMFRQIHGADERIRWAFIQEFVPGRTDTKCRERYVNCLAANTDLSPFREDEKERLIALIDYFREHKTIEGFDGPRFDLEEAAPAADDIKLRAKTIKFTEHHFPWSTVAARHFQKRPDGYLRRQYLQLVRAKVIEPLS